MNDWQSFDAYIEQGAGGIAAIEAAGIGIRENNIRADKTPGWECTDPTAAAAIQAAFNPLTYEQAQAVARIAAYRYGWMEGFPNGTHGIHAASMGFPVKTDDVSQGRLTGAVAVAQANPQQVFNFKDANDNWQQLTAQQIISLFAEVAAFVQACFTNEQTLVTQMKALTDWRAVRIFDVTQGWPA